MGRILFTSIQNFKFNFSKFHQIALKATRPDDNRVKSKHLEALLKVMIQ